MATPATATPAGSGHPPAGSHEHARTYPIDPAPNRRKRQHGRRIRSSGVPGCRTTFGRGGRYGEPGADLWEVSPTADPQSTSRAPIPQLSWRCCTSALGEAEEEVVALRRRLQDSPGRVPGPRGAAPRDQGPARPGHLPEREAHLHAPAGQGAPRRAARGGGEAHPATRGLRHVPRHQRGRHRRRLRRRAQDARRAAPRHRPGHPPQGQRGRPERVAQRRARPRRRARRRGRDPEGGHGGPPAGDRRSRGPTRSGSSSSPTSCVGVRLRAGDALLMDVRSQLLDREAAPPRGRRAGARRGPRHHLRRRRRPRRARSRPSPMRSSCRTCTGGCSPTTSCPPRRASSSTGRRAAARPSSPRRSPTRSPRRWRRRPATRASAATS